MTVTKDDLLYYIANEYAYDATRLSFAEAQRLFNRHYLEIVAVVPGFFNISGFASGREGYDVRHH